MPSSRASSRKAASVGSFSSGTIVANSRSRLTLHDVGHLGRLHVVGAAVLAPRSISFTAASRLAGRRAAPSASGPGRRLKVELPVLMRCLAQRREQRIELAVVLERIEFVAAADMRRRR